MDRGGPFWNRVAAATGIGFAIAGIAIALLAQAKDFENSSDAVGASNEAWGFYTLLLAFAAVLFLWFTSIFVARLRQVEAASGTSGRLANAVQSAGTVFSAGILLAVAAQWAARQLGATDLAELSTAVLEGPTLGFAIATYIGAAGLAVFRAGGDVGAPSRAVALASLALAPAYLAISALQLFNNYAWIDETGFVVFLLWVLAVSAVGVQRWGEIDEGWLPAREQTPPVATAAPVKLEPLERPDEGTIVTRPATRKPAARKKATSAKKPAPRKKSPPRTR